jgi:carbonic anhydrase
MSSKLPHLFANNRAWSKKMTEQDPDFFKNLSGQQAPKYLWIGCSDSRVPSNQIVGLLPGEVFVHRNVANLVVHTDLNCLSVMQFAIEILKVEHIIVCGHYGCGGVRAVVDRRDLGLVNNWLRHLADIRDKYEGEINKLPTNDAKAERLCELNILEQVRNVCESTIVEGAWKAKQPLTIHGWAYSLKDGLLKDLLKSPVSSLEEALKL